MKQKRYKRRKTIPARVKFEKDSKGNNTKKVLLNNLDTIIFNERANLYLLFNFSCTWSYKL